MIAPLRQAQGDKARAQGDKTLEGLRFENTFAALGPTFSEERTPAGIPGARLVAVSPDALALVGLRPDQTARPEFTALVSGNALVRGMEPRAAVYGGHQFGHWAGRLGDGRAILLGETRTETGARVELQIKGGGHTAYSRFGDGRAVERSTIREFLCSEAMHALGIPTTRALAMTSGTEPVVRESVERTATVMRLAPSFVRFGSFEWFASQSDIASVRTLADYVIDAFYPECGDGADRYARFFAAVVERTASLMAHWQSVGFAHGVMNTDNFSILGLTLDYGPFGFLEVYEPGFICNHTDEGGRYAFDQQPTVGLWNCHALAEALKSLITSAERDASLKRYQDVYRETFLRLHRGKLGISGAQDDDADLMLALFELLGARHVDWTRFWRALSTSDADALALLGDDAASRAWFAALRARVGDAADDTARRAAMRGVNPKFVLRNWVAQEAIEASEAGDDTVVRALLDVLLAPFDEHVQYAAWTSVAPERYRDLSVSCSS
jgi:uncharacterized protein YdiU (UPF0061 family)